MIAFKKGPQASLRLTKEENFKVVSTRGKKRMHYGQAPPARSSLIEKLKKRWSNVLLLLDGESQRIEHAGLSNAHLSKKHVALLCLGDVDTQLKALNLLESMTRMRST
jgi:hypothetical protein